MSTIDTRHIGPGLSLDERAKMDADRLWAEHSFNSPNLLDVPHYLKESPATLHQATIQLELIVKWKLAIERQLTHVGAKHTYAMFTDDYKTMKSRADDLAGKAEMWKQEIERFQRKEQGLPEIKRQPTVLQQPPPRPQQPRIVPRRYPAPPKASSAKSLPNHGFSASTTIIPFKAAEAGVKRLAEPEKAEEGVVITPTKKVKVDGLRGADETQDNE